MIFIATCKLGLESLVSNELKAQDIQVISVEDAKITFSGNFSDMIRACLWLRTAERVLFVLETFKATDFEALYEGVRSISFRKYIPRDAFIHVNGKSAKSTLFAVSDCQRIAKKAIVDNLMEAYNTRSLPETGKEVIIEIGLLRDVVTVALDCCGAGLSRRGYRTFNVPAPLSETLGAAIVTLSRYKPFLPLVDPMCGSGTMPIEAAMIANNIAPGMNRDFAFNEWDFIPHDAYDSELERARDSITHEPIDITGSDIDSHSIDLCKKHAKKAGVMLNWAVRPISELPRTDTKGVIVCNPPYGERMLDKKAASSLYREMREIFDEMPLCSKHIITSCPDFEKTFGKTADKRRNLSNGGMKCVLYQYFWKKEQ